MNIKAQLAAKEKLYPMRDSGAPQNMKDHPETKPQTNIALCLPEGLKGKCLHTISVLP